MSKKRRNKHAPTSRKHSQKPPWWRSGRNWVSVGLTGGIVAAVLGVVVWIVLGIIGGSGGGDGEIVYFGEPAAPFTLPTTDGDDVTLADHKGQHNVLLFFNEGEG